MALISSKLKGGLGNQLFQIAAAIALAKKNGTSAVFNLEESKIMDWAQGNKAISYKTTIFRNLKTVEVFNEEKIFKETEWSPEPLSLTGNLLLDGYFQSEEYFKECSTDIKDLFSISKEEKSIVSEYLSSIKFPVVSVHVRRGDYLSERMANVFANIGSDFYGNAMQKMKEILGEEISFVVVSDDQNWARENIQGENVYFSPFTRDIDDFNLMRECSHNIITNSTFSWWAAYLNGNKDKLVIIPKEWFGSRGPPKPAGLYISSWITL